MCRRKAEYSTILCSNETYIPSSGIVSASPNFKYHILQVKNNLEDSEKILVKDADT